MVKFPTSTEDFANYLAIYDCTLVSSYDETFNSHPPPFDKRRAHFIFKCNVCDNNSETYWDAFSVKPQCKICNPIKVGVSAKYSFTDILNTAKERGDKILTTREEYESNTLVRKNRIMLNVICKYKKCDIDHKVIVKTYMAHPLHELNEIVRKSNIDYYINLFKEKDCVLTVPEGCTYLVHTDKVHFTHKDHYHNTTIKQFIRSNGCTVCSSKLTGKNTTKFIDTAQMLKTMTSEGFSFLNKNIPDKIPAYVKITLYDTKNRQWDIEPKFFMNGRRPAYMAHSVSKDSIIERIKKYFLIPGKQWKYTTVHDKTNLICMLCNTEDIYIIGNLREKEDISHIDITKMNPWCHKCAQILRKYDWATIQKNFEDSGCILLSTRDDYVSRDSLLSYICVCELNTDVTAEINDFVSYIHKRSDENKFGEIENTVESDVQDPIEINSDITLEEKPITTTSWRCFKNGARCAKCTMQKRFSTMIELYGADNIMKTSYGKERLKKSCMKKYGVDHATKIKEIHDKIQATTYKNKGYFCMFDCDEVREKRNVAVIAQYGNAFGNMDKCKQACNEKRGCDYPFQHKDIQKKIKKTLVERYGTEFLMHIPEFYRKAKLTAYSVKEKTLSNGMTIKYQGYEIFEIELLLQKYSYEDIIIECEDIHTKMPVIDYEWKIDRKYYPDLYIPKDNLIIEVKSKYTYELHMEQNHKKIISCVEHGYNFILVIFTPKGKIIKHDLFFNHKIAIRYHPDDDDFIYDDYDFIDETWDVFEMQKLKFYTK